MFMEARRADSFIIIWFCNELIAYIQFTNGRGECQIGGVPIVTLDIEGDRWTPIN
jgi:hypothetical protein